MMWKVLLTTTVALAAIHGTDADFDAALGKEAFQTSTANGGVASRAVDGNPSGNWDDGHCTHTKEQANPMWWVDLGQSYAIVKVVIHNRMSCCSERLNPFRILIGDDGIDVSNNPMCGGDHNIDVNLPSITIICQMTGRFVVVWLPGYKRILTLCEVEVLVPEQGPPLLGPLPPLEPPPCIWIVIDVSWSMSIAEFLRILQFILDFILCFADIDVKIGIITFDCLPKLEVRMDEFPVDDPGLTDAVNGLQRRGGSTRTGLALHYVKCMSDIYEDGWSVVILVTDGTEANGQGTDDYEAQAAMLRASGMELYAVAAGYPFLLNTAALGTITGNPDRVVDLTDPCGLANRIIE